MNEIKAYVHRSRVADVIAALKNSPTWGGTRGDRRHNLALYIVKGFLHADEVAEQHFSMELGDEVVNEYKLELLCEDSETDEFILAISTAAHTGQPVAGWITVSVLAQAIPIR
ncbi:MAG: P-II family nitrogen regulator [Ramlibacter sp.]|jgi:nitrogen regulatory protein P-II 1|nr:P-II family nitrogen regulator [Ramlibacter sp.]